MSTSTHRGTSHEYTAKRQALVLEFMLFMNRALRMQDFDVMVDTARTRYGTWKIFPLNRTTAKSTLITLKKLGYVRTRRVSIGQRRIVFYRVTQTGRKAYESMVELL